MRELSPGRDGVAVAWSKSPQGYTTRGGVTILEATADGGGSGDAQWARAFTIDVHVRGEYTVVSTPAGDRREHTVGEGAWFSLGDATGDGRPDILTSEMSGGSGGCATWRVLTGESGTLREIFRRSTCETSMSIRNGKLRVQFATYQHGCDLVHGCGTRVSFLRWDGSEWRRAGGRVLTRFDPD